jgi:hypothetical protein
MTGLLLSNWLRTVAQIVLPRGVTFRTANRDAGVFELDQIISIKFPNLMAFFSRPAAPTANTLSLRAHTSSSLHESRHGLVMVEHLAKQFLHATSRVHEDLAACGRRPIHTLTSPAAQRLL